MFNRRYGLIGTGESPTIFTVPAGKIYIVGQCSVPAGTAVVNFKLNGTLIHYLYQNLKGAVFVEGDVLTGDGSYAASGVMVSREEIDV